MLPLLLSRVANACFWLSRYRERAEFTARVVDVNLYTLLDASHLYADIAADWLPIVQINGCQHLFSGATARTFNLSTVLDTLCLDTANPNSIVSCIRLARENARQAREQISSESWEQINTMYHALNRLSKADLLDRPHDLLQEVKNGALLMQAMADQTMMHGEGWHFIQLGRYLERANTTCRLLTARSDPTLAQGAVYRDALHWIAVLKSASSLEAYHKTYAAPVAATAAIEFLLLDEDSPRSVLFCLERIVQSLTFISGHTGRRYGNEAERLAGQLTARLHYLRLEEIDLMAQLLDIQKTLRGISDSINQTYFAYEVA